MLIDHFAIHPRVKNVYNGNNVGRGGLNTSEGKQKKSQICSPTENTENETIHLTSLAMPTCCAPDTISLGFDGLHR